MKRSYQRNISFILTAVYLLITLSPLASIGSRSNPFFSLTHKECSGDCKTCGCSTERSLSHTCCCWQKKLAEAKNRKHCAGPAPGPVAPAVATTRKTGSCCKHAAQLADHDNESTISTPADTETGGNRQTVSISTCPCGSGKELTFPGSEKTPHIPCRFLTGIPVRTTAQLTRLHPEQLDSQHGEPPEPPPKIPAAS